MQHDGLSVPEHEKRPRRLSPLILALDEGRDSSLPVGGGVRSLLPVGEARRTPPLLASALHSRLNR